MNIRSLNSLAIASALTVSGLGFATNWNYDAPPVIHELVTFGGYNSEARDVNEAGQIVGEADLISGDTHAFVKFPNRNVLDIGTLPGGNFSSASGISENGIVVGTANIAAKGDLAPETRAFIWREGQGLSALTPIAGASDSAAEDVNDKGQVVGNSGGVATLWENGQPKALGTLGGKVSFANAINQKGWVAGTSETADGSWHAFLWQNGRMVDLGTLGGKNSYADGINELGQVIGNSETTSGQVHAFVWDQAMVDADFGIGASTGNAFSRFGLGTGGANFNGGNLHACLWDWNGKLVNLGTLPGREFSYGHAVNDSKLIVGYTFGTQTGRTAVYWQTP
ncbi:MAG: HAF repeat-containing protein [Proteobacteria bacterium]|nr:MAG: HAF repeat-containing protein [Pseudomonadota bacterium]